MDGLVRRARRRWVSNLVLRQVVLATSASLAGLIIVLLAGTDLLSWEWIGGAAALGIAAGAWRLRREIPGGYEVAQAVDSRLGFEDTLSTAYFCRHVTRRPVPGEIRDALTARADALAQKADLEKAVPFCAPRSLYAMAALGVAASGLFAVRYGMSQSLDLRPPLPKMVFDVFHFASKRPQVAKAKRPDKRTEDLLKQFGLSLDQDSQKNGQPQDSPNAPTTQSEQAETSSEKSSVSQQPQKGQEQQGLEGAEGLSVPQPGEEGRETGESQQQASRSGNKGGQQGKREENSLLSKFRDALQNLMSRMKSQKSEGQQSASNQGQAERSDGRDSQGQKGDQSGMKSKGMPGSQGQGEMQEGEGAEQAAEGGKGKQGGQSPQQAANREGRSGIGKDDGSKELKEAEQLAAMGKISEIFGKRSETLTGEVMVETNTSNQQLKTAYSRQNATHTEAGGEISRDEVPLAYQRYVQQYFEEVRKTPPPKATTPAATGAKP